jgi:transposase InsO family protein/transposase-like protein
MKDMVKKYYTDKEKQELVEKISVRKVKVGIKKACKESGISDGSYYQWRLKFSNNNEAADPTLQENNSTDVNLENKIEVTTPKTGGRVRSELNAEVENKIIELKKEYPYYGIVRISQCLRRFEYIQVSPSKVLRVLEKHKMNVSDFYQARQVKEITRFERNNPNDLWCIDIMPYKLKSKEKFSFIGIEDDHSRLILKHGVFEDAKSSNVIKVLQDAVAAYGLPKELLTDCGGQFHSWNGSTEFEELLANFGIRHIKTKPHNPCCNGKIESFHRNLQKELLWRKHMENREQAKEEIRKYIEYYNNYRPHQGIGGLLPSDRYHGIANSVEKYILKPPEGQREIFVMARNNGKIYRIEQEGNEILLKENETIHGKWDLKDGKVLSIEALKEFYTKCH